MAATERWLELAWTLPRTHTERASAALFDLGCLGVQEDHPHGQAPPPRQPWDTGPRPALPSRVVLRAWWPAETMSAMDLLLSLVDRWGGEVE
ncbi:MAG: hypothetical protein AAFV53_43085, partial [Myxococcota bacterium]